MKPLAVFYHCILSNGALPIDTQYACAVMNEQMTALKRSGLAGAAEVISVGVNGDSEDAAMARLFVPTKAAMMIHGKQAVTEIPTLQALRSWLPGHADWYVLYHHIKGVTHPTEPLYARWRKRMEHACVWGWRSCVNDMDNGIDSCGCHWLTPEQFPTLARSAFWGGTFWWATAKYLLTLPPLPPATWANRFAAEDWIGRGPQRPKVRDYYPGWP